MSLIYYIAFNNNLYGYFKLGRLIDLFQMDLIIGLLIAILVMEVRRWKRLKDL
jgi:hypothetical protein